MTLQAWTRSLDRGTMGTMRVDNNAEPGQHDHGFGLGAHAPEPHEVTLGDQVNHPTGAEHGLFDSLGHGADAGTAAALGGHVEIGHLSSDVGHGLHDGLDGLHDSVHHSLGLGFEGDQHHSLHEGLHENLHTDLHTVGHDVPHDLAHDPAHDPQHHDVGLGDLFHH